MGPSALSGGIWKPGIYHYVLCPTSKSLLSRIWTHLVCLEEVGDKMSFPEREGGPSVRTVEGFGRRANSIKAGSAGIHWLETRDVCGCLDSHTPFHERTIK